MSIGIPLSINKNKLDRVDNVEQSINSYIELLLSTPCHSCTADPQFGFIFNNLRFEIFDENEGVVYNSEKADSSDVLVLYNKKISGSSKNLNTFAFELQNVIQGYEKRLSDVTVTMSYIREHKKIYINIKGVIVATSANYQYTTSISVWN